MKKLNLAIFMDALGWETIEASNFLKDLLPNRSLMQSVFGYSSTCIPTILTGELPQDHGHFSSFYLDPDGSPFKKLSGLERVFPSFMNRGRVRNYLSKAIAWKNDYTGYFQIYGMPFSKLEKYNYLEKHDIYEAGGIVGGQEVLFDALNRKGWKVGRSNWKKNDQHNLKMCEQAVQQDDINFYYLYLSEFDAHQHEHGALSDSSLSKLAWYEKQLRELISKARDRFETVELQLFSDHGMCNIEEYINLKEIVDKLDICSDNFDVIYDSTMARFWFHDESTKNRIKNALHRSGYGHWLSDEWLQEQGCYFNDAKFGTDIFLVTPGLLVCPSDMGSHPMKGMHGYSPLHKSSHASFLSNSVNERLPTHLTQVFSYLNERTIQ